MIRSLHGLSTVILLGCLAGCGQPDNSSSQTGFERRSAGESAPPTPSELMLFCGAGLRPPVEELARVFEGQVGVPILRDYAGSEALLGKIQIAQRGDLFLPGDDSYTQAARDKGLADSTYRLCRLIPVILVTKGNPLDIGKLEDLARPGVRVGLGDARSCAVGRLSHEILQAAGLSLTPSFTAATVNALADQVRLGSLDAVIVWDAIARACDCGDIISIPPEKNREGHVEGVVLKSSKHPEWAQNFLRFAASDSGRAIFLRHGYTVSTLGEPLVEAK